MRFTVLSDNNGIDGWACEHGLSVAIECKDGFLLFDTGSGAALMPNLQHAGIEISRISRIVLSHGHYDHTGGLAGILSQLPSAELYCGSEVDKTRYSRHPGQAPRELTMPAASAEALRVHLPSRTHYIRNFTKITDDIFITGAISRESFEDCGGPFFLDRSGETPDLIDDEIALLTTGGILLHGCCHSGIINTIEHCRKIRPDLPVRTVIGGLHLLHASPERLLRSVEYLNSLKLEKMILLHCTGSEAADFLRKNLNCEVAVGKAGEVYDL